MSSFNALRPDPDKVGGVEESPFVRLPDPAAVFAARARRLATLAQGSVLSPYLRFLSGIANAQAECAAALPPSGASMDLRQDEAGFIAALDDLLGHLRFCNAPQAAVEARDRLVALSNAERLALAEDVIAAAYPADRVGECLYVAAAVQVWLTRIAAGIDPASLQPGEDGVCPACGGAPVASVVVGWTQASKARYLCCGLCGTQWNYVRIKCSACGSTEGVTYYHLEGGAEAAPSTKRSGQPGHDDRDGNSKAPPNTIAAEVCANCRSYLKHLHQHTDPAIEPIADDIASYGLDLLVLQFPRFA